MNEPLGLMPDKSPATVLVVLSGGQDSTTCLFWAKQHFEKVHAITFNYGQRHHRELQAAKDVAFLAGVETHEIVNLGPILASTSPLTDPTQPLEQYENFAQMEEVIGDRVEKTFVPMRNTLFLTIAANRAVALGAQNLVTGVCQEDNANYPDCRQDFITALELAFRASLGQRPVGAGLSILTPLMELTKAKSVDLAIRLDCFDALAFSHTAYDGSYPPAGNDHATMLRAESFAQANEPDPLLVRAYLEGLLPKMPEGANYDQHPEYMDTLVSRIDLLRQRLTARDTAAVEAIRATLRDNQ